MGATISDDFHNEDDPCLGVALSRVTGTVLYWVVPHPCRESLGPGFQLDMLPATP